MYVQAWLLKYQNFLQHWSYLNFYIYYFDDPELFSNVIKFLNT